MIDKWSLYRLAQYCDQLVPNGKGGQEPRFTCNVYIQSAESAFDILSKLAGLFRAILSKMIGSCLSIILMILMLSDMQLKLSDYLQKLQCGVENALI